MKYHKPQIMRYFLTFILTLLPFLSSAQSSNLLEIDASSFAPVQTDALSGVAIDKIGMDPSKRPCARIKMHINRMTKEEIEGISVRPIGGSVVVTKRIVAADGNGLIIELTAKEHTRFYLHHDKYGDSNEVSLNLEGNREYRIEASLDMTYTIVVLSNVTEADVYIDDVYKGQIDDSYALTVSEVYPGPHKVRVQHGSLSAESAVDVNSRQVFFRVELNQEQARPQYVFFKVTPADASLVIDGKLHSLNSYGELANNLMLYNGSYPYIVSAKDYHQESGTIVVNGSKVEKTVVLRPAHGWLNVSGEGVLLGAAVYVDDLLIGRAPVGPVRLSSGKHTMRIVQSFYKNFQEQITISDNETLDYAPALEADFANVTLQSSEGSDIYINGQLKGKSPWNGNLSSGVYNFEARKASCRVSSISKEISSFPSQQNIVIPDPEPILGMLDVQSTPSADVYVDNEKVGTTPMNMDLVIGSHRVYLKKDGFKTIYKDVDVKEGEMATIKVELSSLTASGAAPSSRPSSQSSSQSSSSSLSGPSQTTPSSTSSSPKKSSPPEKSSSPAGKCIVLASVTPMPQLSYGLMLGYAGRFGGYAKFRTDFASNKSSYSCSRQGVRAPGEYLSATGNVRKTRMQATGGPVFRIAKWLYSYGGVGYGYRSVLWEDVDKNWAKVTDLSCNGVAAEVGAILKFGPVALSAGVSTTSFKYTELELGIGVMF